MDNSRCRSLRWIIVGICVICILKGSVVIIPVGSNGGGGERESSVFTKNVIQQGAV